MKIAFVGMGFESNRADCWRELAGRPDIDLHVWLEEPQDSNSGFDPSEMMRGISFGWDYSDQITEIGQRQVVSEIIAFGPDVLFIGGLSGALAPYIASCAELRDVAKVLDLDRPKKGMFSCLASCLLRLRYGRLFVASFAPKVNTPAAWADLVVEIGNEIRCTIPQK